VPILPPKVPNIQSELSKATMMSGQPLGSRVWLLSGVLLVTFAGTDAYGFGRCPNYPSMPKFNMSRVS